MVPGVMMFLSLPFPTLIMAFLVGHIAFRTIDAMRCWFMYTNDPSCYGTVVALAVIQNVLLCCCVSASASALTKITALSLLTSEKALASVYCLTPRIQSVFLQTIQLIHNLKCREMSSFIKAGMIFNFHCHYSIGSEQRHLLVEVKV